MIFLSLDLIPFGPPEVEPEILLFLHGKVNLYVFPFQGYPIAFGSNGKRFDKGAGLGSFHFYPKGVFTFIVAESSPIDRALY